MTPEQMEALARAIARQQATHQAQPPVDDRPRERLRGMAQGLTLGAADEIEAFARSKLGGESYDDALGDVRGRLEAYREARPRGAMAAEMLGAVIPGVVGGAATGGGGALATAARIAGMGALGGGAYAFNTGEGGFENRASRVPAGAMTGAAGAALGTAAGAGVGMAARGFTDFLRRSLGPRASGPVEAQIRQAAEAAGLSLDDAVDMVADGRLLAENRTLSTLARAFRAQSTEADTVLREVYENRPNQLRRETMEYLAENLSPGTDPNALRAQMERQATARASGGAEYNRIFANAPEVSDDLVSGLADALKRDPGAAADAARLYRVETGKTPFFSVDQQGQVAFARKPTLEEAEIIRRGLAGAADREFRSGSGAIGSSLKGVERNVRGLLDTEAPDLAAVRQQWSVLEAAKEAFEQGKKALSRSPDEVEVEWASVADRGGSVAEAYRSGLLSAYRNKAATGSGKSLPANLASPDRKEGLILRTVFPGDNLDEMIKKADRAAGAQAAANEILGGSQTAITAGRMGQMADDATSVVGDVGGLLGGDMTAVLRLAQTAIKQVKPGLTSKQVAEAAKLLVESDPAVVRRALTDQGAMNQLYKRVDELTRAATPMATGVGATGGGLLGSNLQ